MVTMLSVHDPAADLALRRDSARFSASLASNSSFGTRKSAPSIAKRLFEKAVTALGFPFPHEDIHCRESHGRPKSSHARHLQHQL